MNKQDIDKAGSALTGAINYFKPMVVALNQADEVFAVLSNAIKLKESLEKDVVNLQATADTLVKQVAESKAAIVDNQVIAEQARAQAAKDIADAKAEAAAEVKATKASVADRTKKTIADSEARIAATALAEQEAQATHNASVAAMSATKAELEASVATLETKLAKLKEQAQKFAASLVE